MTRGLSAFYLIVCPFVHATNSAFYLIWSVRHPGQRARAHCRHGTATKLVIVHFFSGKLQYVDLDSILFLEVVLLITNFPYFTGLDHFATGFS